jgi:hypothetical protein
MAKINPQFRVARDDANMDPFQDDQIQPESVTDEKETADESKLLKLSELFSYDLANEKLVVDIPAETPRTTVIQSGIEAMQTAKKKKKEMGESFGQFIAAICSHFQLPNQFASVSVDDTISYLKENGIPENVLDALLSGQEANKSGEDENTPSILEQSDNEKSDNMESEPDVVEDDDESSYL